MKSFEINVAKEIVAQFSISEDVVTLKFNGHNDAVFEYILKEHPEYSDCPRDWHYKGDHKVFEFYSLGNLVMEQTGGYED